VTDLSKIYKEYFRDVYCFVLLLSRNETIAKEITQEAFFKALKNIDKFKGNCKISVWLCQIAKNTYYTHIGKRKRFETDGTPEKASDSNMEELFLDKEETLGIHRALHCLEEPYIDNNLEAEAQGKMFEVQKVKEYKADIEVLYSKANEMWQLSE
jgi:RNA polymerase sigma factor (sigma-70 family)